VIRFAITHVAKDGNRVLSDPAQARYMYATHREATQHLSDILAANTKDRIASVFGPKALTTFAIKEVDCFDNGDPKRTVF
jgi:hypothetical protein